MSSANEGRRCIVTPFVIGRAHSQNDPCCPYKVWDDTMASSSMKLSGVIALALMHVLLVLCVNGHDSDDIEAEELDLAEDDGTDSLDDILESAVQLAEVAADLKEAFPPGDDSEEDSEDGSQEDSEGHTVKRTILIPPWVNPDYKFVTKEKCLRDGLSKRICNWLLRNSTGDLPGQQIPPGLVRRYEGQKDKRTILIPPWVHPDYKFVSKEKCLRDGLTRRICNWLLRNSTGDLPGQQIPPGLLVRRWVRSLVDRLDEQQLSTSLPTYESDDMAEEDEDDTANETEDDDGPEEEQNLELRADDVDGMREDMEEDGPVADVDVEERDAGDGREEPAMVEEQDAGDSRDESPMVEEEPTEDLESEPRNELIDETMTEVEGLLNTDFAMIPVRNRTAPRNTTSWLIRWLGGRRPPKGRRSNRTRSTAMWRRVRVKMNQDLRRLRFRIRRANARMSWIQGKLENINAGNRTEDMKLLRRVRHLFGIRKQRVQYRWQMQRWGWLDWFDFSYRMARRTRNALKGRKPIRRGPMPPRQRVGRLRKHLPLDSAEHDGAGSTSIQVKHKKPWEQPPPPWGRRRTDRRPTSRGRGQRGRGRKGGRSFTVPRMASLMQNGTRVCRTVMLHRRWALTSAMCVEEGDQLDAYTVRFGTTRRG